MTFNFRADVNAPDVLAAEDAVISRMRDYLGWAVRDRRAEFLSHDLEVIDGSAVQRWDVKFDRHIETTGNCVFESHNVRTDGTKWYGWGLAPDLQYLALMGASRTYFDAVDVARFREYVLLSEMDGTARDWKRFRADNGRWVTHGYCVPVASLWRNRVMLFRVPMQMGDGRPF